MSFKYLSHLSFAVEAKDLKTDAGRASGLDLVQVSEEVESRPATSIIQLALSQHSQQSRLPWVHVTQNRHTKIQELHTPI